MLEFFDYNLTNSLVPTNKIELWPNKILLINYTIIILIGIVGNLSTIYLVIFTNKMHHQITNVYISNLALADLLVVFLVIPENSLRLMFIHPPDICRRIFCKITGFTQGISLAVSVMTLTAISIDRYYIIYKPMKARLITSSKIKLIVCLIWLFSIMIMLPMLFVNKYEEIFLPVRVGDEITFENLFICKEQWPNFELKLIYDMILALCLFLFPIIFMVYAYIKVSNTLCTAEKTGLVSAFRRFSSIKIIKNKLSHNENSQSNKDDTLIQSQHGRNHSIKNKQSKNDYLAVDSLNYQLEITRKNRKSLAENRNEQAIMKLIQSRKRLVKLLIVLVILFFISWLPFHIVSITIDMMHLYQTDIQNFEYRFLIEHIFPVTLFLAHANSAQNPVCFLVLRRDFLKNFKMKFRFCS